MPINKFTTLLDLSRQAKIITGETATFDGKILAGIPFSGYPTGVDTSTAVSLGVTSNQNAVFSGNTGTTIFDLANPLSPNYNAIFSGYTAFTWSNPLFSATTSGLTLPITTLSADTQVLGPYWTLTQTGYTGDYVIGTQYTGYTISYSFFNVSEISSGLFSGVTNAIQENFSAGTLDYKGPLDYLSSKEDVSVDGRLITNKITITNGASSATTNYVLSQIDSTGKGGWNSLSSLLSGSCLPIVNLETVNDCTSGITFNSDIIINGDVVINGSATTINTEIIRSKDNNIILNYSGTHLTAIGGGITLEDGVSNGVDSGIYTDSNGIWTIDPTFRVVGANSTLYYDPTSVGGNLYVSGNTGLPRMSIAIAPYLSRPSTGLQMGMRTWDDVTYVFYGNTGDTFMYAGNEAYGLNIINGPGTNTEDYIRFYAGQYANATADIHIQGSGATRGYVGVGTETPTEKLHVDGSVRIVDGTEQNNYVFTSDPNGVGSWQNIAGIFTGNTSATCITDLYISNLYGCSPITINDSIQSFSTTASGLLSFAFGTGVTASGNFSHAEGAYNIASGYASHAEGGMFYSGKGGLIPNPTSATTYSSHAEGLGTLASGQGSHAEGQNTSATTFYAHSEGVDTLAFGTGSHAEGAGTKAIGTNSHAEGGFTIASGSYSHAEGTFNEASGFASHAEGGVYFGKGIIYSPTSATTYSSHAEGVGTLASGQISHAEGRDTIAGGEGSHAEGSSTIAGGIYSHTEGGGTSATTLYAHAEGFLTLASGTYSHAEGDQTYTTGVGSHAEGQSTIASGSYSHAEGVGNIASGFASHAEGGVYFGKGIIYSPTSATTYSSHAEGVGTIASGVFSHAEGRNTIATGEGSHAEGLGTSATDTASHAEGSGTIASGSYSHAEGANTLASGLYSHAEGNLTIASGNTSHAEGGNTIATGEGSHAEGLDTIASGDYSHAEGRNTIASGDYSHTEGQSTSATTLYAHAEGLSTIASAFWAHAEGGNTLASGVYSHAEGFNTTASATQSHAEGLSTIASGSQSHAEGNNTLSSGQGSHAEGFVTVASGISSHAEGSNTLASGGGSHAEGFQTSATTLYTHSEGNGTLASGIYSHAEGEETITLGLASHAEGKSTTASANFSHAEGNNTLASGISSHAEGTNTLASGGGSHAEGQQTSATTSYSHSEGLGTIAYESYQHVSGRWNNTTNANQYFIIGRGTSNAARANAFRVDSAGNVYGAGATYNSGADYAEYFESLSGNSLPFGTVVELEDDKIKVCVDPNNAIGVISSNPTLIGNNEEGTADEWVGKYEKDEWGRYVMEDYTYEIPDYKNESGDTIFKTITEQRPKISQNFDPNLTYVSRSQRPEWNVVGLVGQVRILKNQQIPTRWIKMKDINADIALYLIR